MATISMWLLLNVFIQDIQSCSQTLLNNISSITYHPILHSKFRARGETENSLVFSDFQLQVLVWTHLATMAAIDSFSVATYEPHMSLYWNAQLYITQWFMPYMSFINKDFILG